MAEHDETLETPKASINKSLTNKYDDPSDPLYLHHSDQPGLVLVTQQLSQSNYPLWSHAMLNNCHRATRMDLWMDPSRSHQQHLPKSTSNGSAAISLSRGGFSTPFHLALLKV